jgi:hypothetical protein
VRAPCALGGRRGSSPQLRGYAHLGSLQSSRGRVAPLAEMTKAPTTLPTPFFKVCGASSFPARRPGVVSQPALANTVPRSTTPESRRGAGFSVLALGEGLEGSTSESFGHKLAGFLITSRQALGLRFCSTRGQRRCVACRLLSQSQYLGRQSLGPRKERLVCFQHLYEELQVVRAFQPSSNLERTGQQ